MSKILQSSLSPTGGPKTSHPELLFLNFNQDDSCISMGHRKGYTITNCDPFGKVYARNEGATSIIEMLFCTSLVAVVGAGDKPAASTRRLQIVNTKRQSLICELTFPTSILAVKMNRKRLVVVLEEQIYIYDISNMKLLHTIETSPNPHAIFSLSSSSENSYLAYPSPLPSPSTPFSANPASPSTSSPTTNPSPSSGDVLLFDALSLSVTNIIQAHKSPVSCISINSTGTLIATASDKGTVIRVFGIPNGERIGVYRRGSYPAKIYSIGFNAVGTLLSVSSDTETVHIFKILNPNQKKANHSLTGRRGRESVDYSRNEEDGSWGREGSTTSSVGGYEAFIDNKKSGSISLDSGAIGRKSLTLGRNIAGSVGTYLLPGSLTEMWEPQRDFAYLKLPTPGIRSLIAFSSSTPQVMVITSEGLFYSYNIDMENGGECILQKSYSLMEGIDDANGSSASED